MRQVIENVESTRRQYALRGRATALGWRDEQIIVVDDDQGESGASASWREGFQRLVSDVGLGRAGIVMGLEVSRLGLCCMEAATRALAPARDQLRDTDADGLPEIAHTIERFDRN